MATEVANEFSSVLSGVYNELISLLPQSAQSFVNLFIIILLVVVYSVFVWKFYRFISTKNLLGLNLNQYNKSSHPLGVKLAAGFFYFIEYIIILPFIIFFWFSVFTLFLILLTDLDVGTLLIVSATIVAAVRMTSYYKEDLSKDLAKLLPFTLLAVALLTPEFFSVERVLAHFSELTTFFGDIINYLIFIVILEIILRFFDFLVSLLGLEEEEENENEKN
ncbi:MAG: hypothetical protein ABIH49_02775 [archaeon]